MQAQVADPQLFPHIRVLISLIVGLGLTRLLTGIARIIQHPTGKAIYWVHLGWVLWMFVSLVNFWWWEFQLTHVEHWRFEFYVFVMIYATGYFLACVLLFPDQMDDYASYRDYFISRRAWFFGLLVLVYLLDVGDTLIKGRDYFAGFGPEYLVRNVSHIALFLMAMRVANLRFHAALVVAAIVYQMSWIVRIYDTLG